MIALLFFADFALFNNNKMEGTRGRLLRFVSYTGLGNAAFEREAGLSNGFLDKTTDRIRKGSLNLISSRFPDLNVDWVINGRGEMLKDEEIVLGDEQGHERSMSDAHIKAIIKQMSEQSAQLSMAQEQLSKAQDQLSVAQAQITRLLCIIELLEKDKQK